MTKTIEEMVKELDGVFGVFKRMFKRHNEKRRDIFGDKATCMRKAHSGIEIFIFSNQSNSCGISFYKHMDTDNQKRFFSYGENIEEAVKVAHDHFIVQGNEL